MSDRGYLFLIGICILFSLYLELNIMIYMLACMLFFEGLTGFSIPGLMQKIGNNEVESGLLQVSRPSKFNFEAFRVLRLVIGCVIFASYLAVHEYQFDMLWFFPWFIGFAVLGAGVSGVCPVYLAIRWLGFK